MRKILYCMAFLSIAPSAFADNTCGTNCTWEITNGELKIHGTGDMSDYDYGTAPWYSQRNSITKVSIDDGITRIGNKSLYSLSNVSNVNLPSTLISIGYESFRGVSLSSIDLPQGLKKIEFGAFMGVVPVLEIPSSVTSIENIHSSIPSLILNANENVSFGTGIFRDWSWNTWETANVQCKGDIKICEKMILNEKKSMEAAGKEFNISYYEGTNKNGNWEVWSDEGQMIYEDSSMQKPLAKYDFDGNQTGLYQYDSGGNLIKAVENGVTIYQRRIYTPSEATAAVQNNKNTFSIIYR